MWRDADEFERIVVAVVARFWAQNGRAEPSAADLRRFAAQLRELVAERGLPRALGPGECGAPGGMSEEECAPLVGRVVTGIEGTQWAEAAKQLVKACFYPEFTVCRESYRELTREGACKRQELERVRGRMSGTHCIDCPHWTSLSAAQHGELIELAWRGDAAELARNRGIFLPEDFRALRQWLHAAARS